MAVLLSPVGGVAGQFFDNNGNPLTGGKLYSYVAGTTTPQATYTSSAGTVAHSNPIILDAGGRVPGGEIWLTDGLQYKFVLKNATDVLIGTYDNIIGINSNFVNFLTETEVQTATASQTVFTLTTMQYQPGTNNLTVYVDGVNQIDGSTYSYVETSSTVITFTAGLHVGALVKFTTAQTLSTGVTDASLVTYDPPFTNSVTTTVELKLAQTVSVLDFGADPTATTDSQSAFQAAVTAANNGTVFVPSGNYKINTTVVLTQGITIQGAGQVAVNIVSPAGINMFSLASSGATELRGVNLFDMTLEADLVLQLNNTSTFVDSNTGPIVGGSVKRCRFYNITSGVGQAINASQMFDTVISENKFAGTFNIAILMNGCDLNTISHNRFTAFTNIGILDTSAQFYGSSNLIEHNDMTLQTVTNATFIKSTSLYVIIKDNYLEQIGSGTGIGIDCTLTGSPAFGSNVQDNSYSIWIENNRIEPEANFQYCVRLDPTKAQAIVCKNPSSTVASGTSIFNTTGNLLPMASNNFVVPSVEISGQSWGVWDDYKSSGNVYSVNGGFCADGTTKDAFPYTSVGNYNSSVSLLGKSIVMASPLVGGNRVVITPNPTSNTYFPAVTITVILMARTSSASGDTLTVSYIDDTNGPTSIVSCALTQQYQKFTGTFTGYGLAFTKAGILLNRATTNGNAEILSVFWSY